MNRAKQHSMKRHPTLLGVPVDSSGGPRGCEHSPKVLRQYGLASAVNAQSDLNDLPVRIVGARDVYERVGLP